MDSKEQEDAGPLSTPSKPEDRITLTASSASGSDLKGSSLLPMLIAGLILIVVGMVAVVFIA